ncbi:hypothetical protein REPUB_Repub17cG0090000 [Reevesia pubescens]
MKFNVDGSFYGNPGSTGIQRALKENEGAFKMLFSKDIGVTNAALAEMLAVKEGFLLFAALKWARTHGLIIECDNKNVLDWI